LIATLTENHTPQMEALIKSTTYAMKEMMQLMKKKPKHHRIPQNCWTRTRRKREMKNANGTMKHQFASTAGKMHPLKKEDECWELEKNKASHPNT
jgi:hypothetical protein